MKRLGDNASGNIISFPGSRVAKSVDVVPEQLELSFDYHPRLWFLAVDELGGLPFVNEIERIKPHIIVDLRHFPRFDLTGVNGQALRNWITHSEHRYYLQLGLPLHAISQEMLRHNPANLADKIFSRIETSRKLTRDPIAFLVQTTDHARAIAPYLQYTADIRAETSWRIHILPEPTVMLEQG